MNGFHAVEAGFNLLIQDVRGRYESKGVFEPYVNESADGSDTVDWVRSQSWSDGKVGMIGRSYAGLAQWACATSRSGKPGLEAIAPEACCADLFEGWAYKTGVFRLGFMAHWTLSDLMNNRQAGGPDPAGQHAEEGSAALLKAVFHSPQSLREWSLSAPRCYRDWLEHREFDAYWRERNFHGRLESVGASTLVIGGWYDDFLDGALNDFSALQRRTSPGLDSRACLIVGPWNHLNRTGSFRDREFPAGAGAAGSDLSIFQIEWFRTVLNRKEGTRPLSPVNIYVMGAGEWRGFDHWPPRDTVPMALYLHSGGNANSASGDGLLRAECPGASAEDIYLHDPTHPVPTVGCTGGDGYLPDSCIEPADRREIESRMDVLCYTTPPLENTVLVIGKPKIRIYVSTSADSTDFIARLLDVFPDGRAWPLCDGIYRLQSCRSAPTSGNVPDSIMISLGAIANCFLPLHRIRLEISSSSFPEYDLNRGFQDPDDSAEKVGARIVRNHIRHGTDFPSTLVLPLT